MITRAALYILLVALPVVQSLWLAPATSLILRGAWPVLWVLCVMLRDASVPAGIGASLLVGLLLEGFSSFPFGTILIPLLLPVIVYLMGRETRFNPSPGSARFWAGTVLAAFFLLRALIVHYDSDDLSFPWSFVPILLLINLAGYALLGAAVTLIQRIAWFTRYAATARKQS